MWQFHTVIHAPPETLVTLQVSVFSDVDLTWTLSCMPECTHVDTEELLKEGCCCLIREKCNGIKINVKQTALDLNVPYTTLWSRFLNVHKPAWEAHASQQFLFPSQERLLGKWVEHLGSTGRPLYKWTIWIRAHSIFTQTISGLAKTGFMPSSNDIRTLYYPRNLALTRNVRRLLIVPLSINTLINSKSLLNSNWEHL